MVLTQRKMMSAQVLERLCSVEEQREALEKERDELREHIKPQLEEGWVIPSTYRAYLKETSRRNPKWKEIYLDHVKSEGADVKVEEKRIVESVEPSVSKSVVVERAVKKAAAV